MAKQQYHLYSLKIDTATYKFYCIPDGNNMIEDIFVDWSLQFDLMNTFKGQSDRQVINQFRKIKQEIEREVPDSIINLDFPLNLSYYSCRSRVNTRTGVTINLAKKIERREVKRGLMEDISADSICYIEKINFVLNKYLLTFVDK